MEEGLKRDVLVEECPMCGSHNYIFRHNDSPAYECYCCLNTFWISDDDQLQYCLENDLDIFEANFLLKQNQVPVLHGEINV